MKKLAENFSPALVGTPVLSHRNGRYFVVDGQQRFTAAIRCGHGETVFTALVYENLTSEIESMLYVQLNLTGAGQRVPITPAEHFKAQEHYTEKDASEISSILARHGITMVSGHRPRNINAVTTVLWVHSANCNLDRTLQVLLGWCPDGGIELFHQSILRGISSFLRHFPALDVSHFIKRLQTTTPTSVRAHIKTIASLKLCSKDILQAYVMHFGMLYNNALGRKVKKLDLTTLQIKPEPTGHHV